MAGRVDQVEDVILAVAGAVFEPHRLRLDGDAALALDVHGIEHLLAPDHLALVSPPVSWISRSASVDLPWSICAMIAKLRMFSIGRRRHGGQITLGLGGGKRRHGDVISTDGRRCGTSAAAKLQATSALHRKSRRVV